MPLNVSKTKLAKNTEYTRQGHSFSHDGGHSDGENSGGQVVVNCGGNDHVGYLNWYHFGVYGIGVGHGDKNGGGNDSANDRGSWWTMVDHGGPHGPLTMDHGPWWIADTPLVTQHITLP